MADPVSREDFVAADGFRIRYREAGDGPPLVHLHGAGGMRWTAAHDLLARQFRVIAFEMPGFGSSAENTRTRDMPELALTMAHAAGALGLDRFNLWGTSFGGKTGLWLAVQAPERLDALVLELPAAIRPPGGGPASGTPEEMARQLYGHPERMPPIVPPPSDCRGTDPRAGWAADGQARELGARGAHAFAQNPDAGAVRHARPADPAGHGPPLQGIDAGQQPPRAGLRFRPRDLRRAPGSFRRSRRRLHRTP